MYWGPDSREPHYTRSDRCTSIPVPPERQSWLKLSLQCRWLAFGCVCMMKCWIVVIWARWFSRENHHQKSSRGSGTISEPKHTLSEEVFTAKMSSPALVSTCLKIQMSVFFRNSLCRSRPNLSPRMSARVIQDNFWAKFRYVSLRILLLQIASCPQKKVFENSVLGGMDGPSIPPYF